MSRLEDEELHSWIDDARDRICIAADRLEATPRDFAATVVAGLVDTDRACIAHVGDGACIYRLQGETGWSVGSWPAQGEYASTTFFITDDPGPAVNITRVEGQVSEIAIFTDGLERLALDFAEKEAFQPFFETMFAALVANAPGRIRPLSRSLRAFLESAAVTDRTDDDKTLIMARRLSCP